MNTTGKKQVCIFHETTWIIKIYHHDFNTANESIAYDFLRSTNMTVNSVGAAPQFIKFDELNNTWS